MKQTPLELVKQLWNTWDIRFFMLTSLSIQALLTFLAPFRKSTGSCFLRFILWLLYLSADAVALFSIGLITSSQEDDSPQKQDLLSFWAPFLLLHLGGPDTITALALEDNELWRRHALQLATQLIVTLYVFVQSLRGENHLWIPTILMFVDGCVKYIERTEALYYASTNSFRESLATKPESRPDYARFMEVHSNHSDNDDYTPTIEEKCKSLGRDYQDDEVPSDTGDNAISIVIKDVEAEMKEEGVMIKDAYKFYMKFQGLLADAFLSLVDREESRSFFLDKAVSKVYRVIQIELNFVYDVFYTKVLQFLRCTRGHRQSRWSESISRYNLLDRCFRDPPSILNCIGVKRIRDPLMGFLYVETEQINEKLVVNFIIQELQKKAKLATDIQTSKEVYSARGNLVLEKDYFLVSEYLNPWTLDVEYDESVLIWHLATDICYWTSDEIVQGTDYRNFCKQISDYMTYLLLRQKSLVSLVVGMSELRFDDTCEEAKKFMDWNLDIGCFAGISALAKKFMCKKSKYQISSSVEGQSYCRKQKELLFREFSNKVLKAQAHVQPIVSVNDKSKSVLVEACRLTKQLKRFGDVQWEITSKVWVELLCYAATRCSPKSHVAQLSKGGELITLVWLLMAHLGLGERFLQNQGFGWTKLIIHK